MHRPPLKNELKLARLRHARGAAALEYALMMALIATVIVVVVTSVGARLSVIFATVASSL